MQYLAFLLDVGVHHDVIGLLLGFSEDDSTAMYTGIDKDDISYNLSPLMIGAVDSQMLDGG